MREACFENIMFLIVMQDFLLNFPTSAREQLYVTVDLESNLKFN